MTSTVRCRIGTAMGTTEARELEVARWHPIVASNRGPLEYVLTDGGALVGQPTSGGVVTALSGLARHVEFTWVANAASTGDRLAAESMLGKPNMNPSLRFVVLSPEVYQYHYNLFSNPLLWFLQHSLWSKLGQQAISSGLATGWMAGYRPANAAFAAAIAGEARRLGTRPVVLLQDYHLYLVAGYLRQMLAGALLQHFVHIPWPEPAAWRVLPAAMRQQIFRALLANDIVGFQTARDARQFLAGCATFLPEADVDIVSGRSRLDSQETLVRVYPISIDVAAIRETLATSEVAAHHRRLQSLKGERTIVRVDRLDPSKDVANGFRAFDRLLELHPEWRGRVKFLVFLVPSRTGIPEYRHHADESFSLVAQINARHGYDGYRPIEVFYENNRAQAMAGLMLYDVLLVNPVADGMNLVAKEGSIANERDGVLVLSDGAGAHEQLGRAALSVARGDVAGIAEALAEALGMSLPERRCRAALLRGSVEEADLRGWLNSQLDDLATIGGNCDMPSLRPPQSPSATLAPSVRNGAYA